MAKQSKAAKLAAEIKAKNYSVTAAADRAQERSELTLVEPTKSQLIMIGDGLPVGVVVSDAAREEGWKANPPKATTWIEKQEAKEVPADVLAFAAEEETRKSVVKKNRIAKMVNKTKTPDLKTHRWNSGKNKWEPLDPTKLPEKKAAKVNVSKIKKAADKKAGVQKKATVKKTTPKEGSTEGHSAIAIAAGVKSVNRRAALDKLNSDFGKQITTKILIKAVYGNTPASDGAFHTVMKALERDITNKGAKFEIHREKVKEEITYGLYSKK